MGAILLFLLFIGVYLLFLWLKKQSAQSKVNFLNSCLAKALIQAENPNPKSYKLYLPIKAYNIHKRMTMPSLREVKFDGPLRVDISLIYFSFQDGHFCAKSTKIDYGLDELYSIFRRATRFPDSQQQIYVHWDSNNLIIYPDESAKTTELKRLRKLFFQMQDIEDELSHLEEEEKKVKALIKTVGASNLYHYQIEAYRKGLFQIEKLKLKAVSIRDSYLTFLKERILGFYIADVGSSMLQVINKENIWELKYKEFQDEYNLLKTMVDEYRNLSKG